MNTTIALRGVPEDYDEWASLGNRAWAWDRVLPAFKRLERDLDFGDAPYHGDAGPISIRRYPPRGTVAATPCIPRVGARARLSGLPRQNDPWAYGSGPQPMNKLGRLRVSCAIGYLAPARARPNLTIRANTFVRRLIIEGGRCTGVEVERPDGSIEGISAKLVVLCAGALLSPAILMRSGIGPRAHLEALSIDVLRDVPGVGANLSDHPALSVACLVKDGSIIDFDQPLIQTILRYTAKGSDKRNDLQIEQISFVGPQRRTADVRDRRGARIPIRTRRTAVALGRSARHADRRQPFLRRRARHGAAGRLLQGRATRSPERDRSRT